MMQAVYHQCPNTNVEYTFKCRNKGDWTPEVVAELNKQIDAYCELKFKEKELRFISGLEYFKQDFIDFLSLYKPNRKHITLFVDKNEELQIHVKGSWVLTMPFEVPILAMVNETYFKTTMSEKAYDNAFKMAIGKILSKIELLERIPFADFGTRRRFSKEIQEAVVNAYRFLSNFAGTSNVLLAMRYGVKPIGTMAHEWFMGHQGMEGVRIVDSQKTALQNWVNEYRGDLGIALTDTIGIDAFLQDFDKYFAKLYDGVRHDSGDPIVWGDKIIAHYESLGIDPQTKTLVFSDGLNCNSAWEIFKYFNGRAKISFGIGTHLSNDTCVTPLQVVMKLTECNGQPTAKISDEPGKIMSKDMNFAKYLVSCWNKE